jgi:hypothetical protein
MVIIMKNLNGYVISKMVMENTVTEGNFSSLTGSIDKRYKSNDSVFDTSSDTVLKKVCTVVHAAVRNAKFTIFKIDSADSAGDQFISNVSDKFTSDNRIFACIAGISVLRALLHVYYYQKNTNMCFA